MRHLCDSNVFLALTASGHRHHAVARNWFAALGGADTAAFCRMTQMAFLRLLTTQAVMGEHALSNRRAIEIYEALLRHRRVSYAEVEPMGMEAGWLGKAKTRDSAPKQWMDAYLAAFSQLSHMRFVTFDRGFRSFVGLDLLVL